MKTLLLTIFTLFFISRNEKPAGCLKMDVMILADVSGSVYGQEPFIHSAIKGFVDRFELSEEGMKIGLATFGDGVFLISPLTSDNEELQKSIKYVVSDMDNGTNMTAGLMVAGNHLIEHGRPGYAKIVILITDGLPDYRPSVRDAADLIKSTQTLIFGIFVSEYAQVYNPVYNSFYNSSSGEEFLEEISSPACFVRSDYKNLIKELEKLDICM